MYIFNSKQGSEQINNICLVCLPLNKVVQTNRHVLPFYIIKYHFTVDNECDLLSLSRHYNSSYKFDFCNISSLHPCGEDFFSFFFFALYLYMNKVSTVFPLLPY